jgi:hypothetical protein
MIGSKASPVRFSYAQVWEPRAIEEGQTPKYSVALLIPKSDKATIKAVEKAIEAAKQEGKPKWGGKIPNSLKVTELMDGDVEKPDDDTYAGHFYINAKSINAPQIVDESTNPIIDKNEFYSGCYGRATVNFYPFNVNVNKGVACGLGNIQKLKDGPSLGGGSTAAQDFGDDDEI